MKLDRIGDVVVEEEDELEEDCRGDDARTWWCSEEIGMGEPRVGESEGEGAEEARSCSARWSGRLAADAETERLTAESAALWLCSASSSHCSTPWKWRSRAASKGRAGWAW